MGTVFAPQATPGQVFRQVMDQTEPFQRSKPRPLAGYPDRWLTLDKSTMYVGLVTPLAFGCDSTDISLHIWVGPSIVDPSLPSGACIIVRFSRGQHQWNVFQSLGASRSVWEDVEVKLRSINFRRESDHRRVMWPAFRVCGISDDWYRSSTEVILIWFGTHWRTGENIGFTWQCSCTNVGITYTLWDMAGFLWVFIRMTAGITRNSPEEHK